MKRIMIAGTNSGCGKTTITCAVLQALVNRGYNVSSFKCGPDYIDPMFHSKIIGAKSRNLDRWFCNKDTVNYLLHKNSGDISVIEGVMGFYDGANDKASSCHVALDTGTPVVIVINCKGMSMSIGAAMKGFLTFRKPNNIAGFIFNHLPESLIDMVKNLCSDMKTEYLGRFPDCTYCKIESRHLGLVTANEINGLKEKMQRLAETAEKNILIDRIIDVSENAVTIDYVKTLVCPEFISKSIRIAVAYDKAFCFYYEDNLDMLREMGCEIVKFSPLSDHKLPNNISGLIIGGGYPELYAEKLSENKSILEDIRCKISDGLPTIAECGGFMYLHKTLEGNDENDYNMVGAIDGRAYKTDRLQRFGYIVLTALSDNMLCGKGLSISAHEFHYWDSTYCGSDFIAEKISGRVNYNCIHASDSLYAGFPHLYFYANSQTAITFVKKCDEYRGENEKS